MEDILKNLLTRISQKAPQKTAVPYTVEKKQADPLKSYLTSVTKKAEENKRAILNKSPFLANLQADTTSLMQRAGKGVERVARETVDNITEAGRGNVRVTKEDYAEGAAKILGGGAKAITEGTLSFGKSIKRGILGKEASERDDALAAESPAFRAFMKDIAGTEDVLTAQEYIPAIEDYAVRRGANPTEAKSLGLIGFFGIMAANNPAFSEAKAGGKALFELSKEGITTIAKTEDVTLIRSALIKEGLDEETATKLAPAFKYADKPAQVKGVVEDIKNGAKVAEEFATNDEVAGATLRERGFGKTAQDVAPEIAPSPEQYIQRNTEQLAVKAANLVKDDIVAAEARAMSTDLSDDVVAVSSELLKEYRRQAEGATDASVKEIFDKKYSELSRDISRKLTEAGRYAQAASILRSETPDGKVRFALRQIEENNAKKGTNAKKLKPLSDDEIVKIRTDFEQAEKMPEGIEKERAWAKAEEELAKRVNPAPWYKKLTGLWKAGLLTSFRTLGLNQASTAFNMGLEQLSRIPAVGTDVITSLITKKRTVTLASEMTRKLDTLIKTGKVDDTGFVEGAKKGWEYLKTGYDERRMRDATQMAKIDYGNSPVGKLMTAYVDSVFKVVGAGDFPYFYGVRASSMFDQATAAAKNSGLKGKEYKEFIDGLLKNPTDEMIENATADALIATFNNDTALGRAGSKIQDIPLIGEIIVPFSRTPGAVAMQVVNYTPVGPTLEVAKQIKNGSFDQRAFSKAMGRGITGTGAMYLGYLAYQNGIMSLNREQNERDQKQAELEGRRPNAIKVGDRWLSAASAGPLGLQMILGGYLARGIGETGSVVNAVAQTALGMGTLMSEQSMMQGLKTVVDAATDPERFAANYVEGLIGSTIPTIIADVANASDPVERETPGLFDTFQMRTPLWRQTLTPKVNTFGEKIGLTKEQQEDAWTRGKDGAAAFFDFTRSTQANSSPIIEELKRLKDAGYSATPTKLGNKNGYESLSAEENFKLWSGTGMLVKGKLSGLIQMPEYQELDDEGKKKLIDKIVDQSKTYARAGFVDYMTAGLGKEELMQHLSAYKKDGLLTKEVFNLWEENQ